MKKTYTKEQIDEADLASYPIDQLTESPMAIANLVASDQLRDTMDEARQKLIQGGAHEVTDDEFVRYHAHNTAFLVYKSVILAEGLLLRLARTERRLQRLLIVNLLLTTWIALHMY